METEWTPRWPEGCTNLAALRRMRCGRWKVAGKAYRTKALARRGAAKRGLMLLEPMPWSALRVLAVAWGVDTDGDDLRGRVLREMRGEAEPRE